MINHRGVKDASANAELDILRADLRVPRLEDDDHDGNNTHTTKGTAEEISGFDAGAVVEIWGIDTAVWVGAAAADAQGNGMGSPAGVPFRFKLDGSETTFHVDAATGGTYYYHQVS